MPASSKCKIRFSKRTFSPAPILRRSVRVLPARSKPKFDHIRKYASCLMQASCRLLSPFQFHTKRVVSSWLCQPAAHTLCAQAPDHPAARALLLPTPETAALARTRTHMPLPCAETSTLLFCLHALLLHLHKQALRRKQWIMARVSWG